MTEKEEILDFLMETIGEEGCGVECKEAEVSRDQAGWQIFLGINHSKFMEDLAASRIISP